MLNVANLFPSATQRHLIFTLVRREVAARYRGAMLGNLWALFTPLFMLAVYTFIFSVVFKARWSGGSDSRSEFALVLFAGLMVFNLFAECFNRAPRLILDNVNYVKKVVFPLEILPWVALGSALVNLGISLLVWLAFYGVAFGVPPVTVLLFPLMILPLLLLVLGLSWALAALGVGGCIVPSERFDSEALLELPALAATAGARAGKATPKQASAPAAAQQPRPAAPTGGDAPAAGRPADGDAPLARG